MWCWIRVPWWPHITWWKSVTMARKKQLSTTIKEWDRHTLIGYYVKSRLPYNYITYGPVLNDYRKSRNVFSGSMENYFVYIFLPLSCYWWAFLNDVHTSFWGRKQVTLQCCNWCIIVPWRFLIPHLILTKGWKNDKESNCSMLLYVQ